MRIVICKDLFLGCDTDMTPAYVALRAAATEWAGEDQVHEVCGHPSCAVILCPCLCKKCRQLLPTKRSGAMRCAVFFRADRLPDARAGASVSCPVSYGTWAQQISRPPENPRCGFHRCCCASSWRIRCRRCGASRRRKTPPSWMPLWTLLRHCRSASESSANQPLVVCGVSACFRAACGMCSCLLFASLDRWLQLCDGSRITCGFDAGG